MRNLVAFSAAAILLSLPGAATAAPDAKNRTIVVHNASSQEVRELYASPITATIWEEDLLGQQTLPAGGSLSTNLDNGTAQCFYDFRAVLANGKAVERRKVDVCVASKWVIADSGNKIQ